MKGPHLRPKAPRHGHLNGCPSMDCAGGTPDRQNDLSDGQLGRVSVAAKEAISTAKDRARRCSYCGCVYLAADRKILGYLDNGVSGEGWIGR